jgi:hypothetical protein
MYVKKVDVHVYAHAVNRSLKQFVVLYKTSLPLKIAPILSDFFMRFRE